MGVKVKKLLGLTHIFDRVEVVDYATGEIYYSESAFCIIVYNSLYYKMKVVNYQAVEKGHIIIWVNHYKG
jgi:hypothetical protein